MRTSKAVGTPERTLYDIRVSVRAGICKSDKASLM